MTFEENDKLAPLMRKIRWSHNISVLEKCMDEHKREVYIRMIIKYEVSNKFITFAMVKYNDLFRLLKNDGWIIIRQKGSHVILRHPVKSEQLTIPYHPGKEVKKGLFNAILKQACIKHKKQ